jgi:hypothetical protein
MKKLLLILLLLALTSNVYAEWIKYSSSQGGYFYDNSSIKRSGNKVKVWTYNNAKSDDEKAKSLNTASWRGLDEIDCVNETSKTLSLQTFTKIDLSGDMQIINLTNLVIDYIPPESVTATLMKLVCKK